MATAPAEAPTDREKPYHHGDLRAALIRAGLAILAEEGVQALSLRAAARRAGVSHAAPYRHFAAKEALLAAIAAQGFNLFAAELEAARDRLPAAPRQQLEETAWAYVRFALAHPDHLRVMFGGLIVDPGVYPGLREAGSRAFAVLVDIVRAGQDTGAIIAGESRLLAFVAWTQVHGLSLLLIGHQEPRDVIAARDAEQLARSCSRLFYTGLALRE
ncbi:MAG TPA: TetR/AcrR family transcriptional regulator [Ktedonobacterales bacterium]|nr:TetR/AcrR family transcriptional regulator [Ktedonobacterales bacterium]